jgi:hypothetical protein
MVRVHITFYINESSRKRKVSQAALSATAFVGLAASGVLDLIY